MSVYVLMRERKGFGCVGRGGSGEMREKSHNHNILREIYLFSNKKDIRQSGCPAVSFFIFFCFFS